MAKSVSQPNSVQSHYIKKHPLTLQLGFPRLRRLWRLDERERWFLALRHVAELPHSVAQVKTDLAILAGES